MSIYSGFATRQTQTKYNHLIYKLIFTLQSHLQQLLQQSQLQYKKLRQYSQLINKIKSYQQHKYLQPKFTSSLNSFIQKYIHNKDSQINNTQLQQLHSNNSLKNISINILPKTQIKKQSQSLYNQRKLPVFKNHFHNKQHFIHINSPQTFQRKIHFTKNHGTNGSRNSNAKSVSHSAYTNNWEREENKKNNKKYQTNSEKQMQNKKNNRIRTEQNNMSYENMRIKQMKNELPKTIRNIKGNSENFRNIYENEDRNNKIKKNYYSLWNGKKIKNSYLIKIDKNKNE